MTDTVTYEEYQALVETQGLAMLDVMAFVATGDLDIDFEVPEGIEVLSELGLAFSFLLEDFRNLVDELQKTQQELEMRVEERTRELQEALNQAQVTYRRYIQNEWTAYSNPAASLAVPEYLQPTVAESVQEQKLVKDTSDKQQANLALPITFANEVIGVLGFSEGNAENWRDEDLADVEAIVEQVGIALENQRLHEQTQAALAETQDQASRLAQLSELGTALSQTGTLVSALETMSQAISGIVDFDRASVTLVVSPEEYEVVLALGLGDQAPVGTRNQLRGSTIARAVQTHRLIANDNLTLFDDYQAGQNYQGMGSNLCAPLLIGGEAIGTLNLGSERPYAFDQRDKSLATQLATLLASTIENQRLLEQAQQRARREQLLREVTARIRSSTDVETVMQMAVKEVGDALNRPAYLSINTPQVPHG